MTLLLNTDLPIPPSANLSGNATPIIRRHFLEKFDILTQVAYVMSRFDIEFSMCSTSNNRDNVVKVDFMMGQDILFTNVAPSTVTLEDIIVTHTTNSIALLENTPSPNTFSFLQPMIHPIDTSTNCLCSSMGFVVNSMLHIKTLIIGTIPTLTVFNSWIALTIFSVIPSFLLTMSEIVYSCFFNATGLTLVSIACFLTFAFVKFRNEFFDVTNNTSLRKDRHIFFSRLT